MGLYPGTEADSIALHKKMSQKYEIILYWSDEDQVFIAEVPELPGCVAHGDTQRAALQHVNDAMTLWLDTARQLGRPLLESKGRRLAYA